MGLTLEPRGSATPDGLRAIVDTSRRLPGDFTRKPGELVVQWYDREMKEERWIGRCKGCKRAVSALLPGAVHKRTEHSYGRAVTRSWTTVTVYGEQGAEDWARWVPCPDCQGAVFLKRVDGKLAPDHRCDARCTGAKGPSCECSCGGVNHGADWE